MNREFTPAELSTLHRALCVAVSWYRDEARREVPGAALHRDNANELRRRIAAMHLRLADEEVAK